MANKLEGLGELVPWDEVSDDFKGRRAALLIGNGMSRSVWDEFAYPSLYERACKVPDRPLAVASQKLFDHVGGRNFEQVLAMLIASKVVVDGLGIDDGQKIELCRDNVRDALVEAVRSVHVPWSNALIPNLEAIRAEFTQYLQIYTTNYDLIPYWALMRDDSREFKDFFVDGEFRSYRAPEGVTPLYYLHGALHLYTAPEHVTFKRAHDAGKNLLDQFDDSFEDGNRPLFVSEGNAESKLLSINDSDYLSFCYDAFTGYRGRLVVFGHGLDPDVDSHLLEALHANQKRQVAVSIYPPGTKERVAKIQTDLIDRMPGWDITFFDLTTHPLGLPERKVKPPNVTFAATAPGGIG